MQLGTWFGISASLFGLGLVACGSEDDDGFVQSVPLQEVPAKYAGALCQAYSACLGPLAEIYLPGEDCVQRTTDMVEDGWGSIEAGVEAKRIKYDGTKLDKCIAELEARTCDELLEREPEACSAAFEGTVADGEDCSQSEECLGLAYCSFDGSCPGTCQARETTGGACKSDSQCASGLVCSKATERCVTPAGEGEPCGGAEPECVPGFFCKGANEDDGTPGTCRGFDEVFAGGAGDACSITETQLCAPGFACGIDAVTAEGVLEATCTAKVGSGDACQIAFPDMCPPDEYCNVPGGLPVTLEGTCTARPEAGEDCAAATPFDMVGTICAPYARCDGGKCRALAGLGESCEGSAVCLSEHCQGGACVSGDACE